MKAQPEKSNQGVQFVTVQEVSAMLKTCPKTITRMVQRGTLPKPVALSARCLRFDLSEVLASLQKAKA